jgi:bacterioferritin-associated ferredoxin
MYVCLCNGYRDREVRDAVSRGARSVEEAYALLGEPACCGSCIPCAESIIDETMRSGADGAAPHLLSVAE